MSESGIVRILVGCRPEAGAEDEGALDVQMWRSIVGWQRLVAEIAGETFKHPRSGALVARWPRLNPCSPCRDVC
jgi:hypothetical protein